MPNALTRLGVSSDGDGVRMARVVAKLRKGEPLTIAALGGSICTSEYAGCTRPSPASRHDGNCGFGRGWARLVADFLNAAYP